MLHFMLAVWTWIAEPVYSTQMFPLSHSGGRDRLYLHLFRSVPGLCGGLLLFLLIISRPHSADHHSFIPQILTWDGRVFVAGSCCLQELLLHQCQIVNFNVTCHFSPPTVFFNGFYLKFTLNSQFWGVFYHHKNELLYLNNKHFSGFSSCF